MAHINLLPWREARREELKRAFLSILGLVVAAAVVVTMARRSLRQRADRQPEGAQRLHQQEHP
jgi:type IV pilus assembly protein PilN